MSQIDMGRDSRGGRDREWILGPSVLTLKGSGNKAQGASPGFGSHPLHEPCKGGGSTRFPLVPAPFQGLIVINAHNPRVSPWALYRGPFRAVDDQTVRRGFEVVVNRHGKGFSVQHAEEVEGRGVLEEWDVGWRRIW